MEQMQLKGENMKINVFNGRINSSMNLIASFSQDQCAHIPSKGDLLNLPYDTERNPIETMYKVRYVVYNIGTLADNTVDIFVKEFDWEE